MAGEGSTWEEKSEQRPGGEGVKKIQGRGAFQAEGTANAGALRLDSTECAQNSQEASVAGVEGGREGGELESRYAGSGCKCHGWNPMSTDSQGGAFTPPCLCAGCSLHWEFWAFSGPSLAGLAACPSSLQLCSSLFPGESEGCVFSVPTTLWMHPDTRTDSPAWLPFVFVSPMRMTSRPGAQSWCPNRGVQETVCGARLGVNDGAEQSRESAL